MKKKIIALIILVLGLSCLGIGIVYINNNNKEVESSAQPNNNNNYDKNVGVIPEDDPDNDGLLVYDFKTEKVEDGIKVSFTKYNSGENDIENKAIYINLYNNDKLLISYPHEFQKLKVGEEAYVEEKIPIYDDNVTDYLLIYNFYRLELLTKEEFNKIKTES